MVQGFKSPPPHDGAHAPDCGSSHGAIFPRNILLTLIDSVQIHLRLSTVNTALKAPGALATQHKHQQDRLKAPGALGSRGTRCRAGSKILLDAKNRPAVAGF